MRRLFLLMSVLMGLLLVACGGGETAVSPSASANQQSQLVDPNRLYAVPDLS